MRPIPPSLTAEEREIAGRDQFGIGNVAEVMAIAAWMPARQNKFRLALPPSSKKGVFQFHGRPFALANVRRRLLARYLMATATMG